MASIDLRRLVIVRPLQWNHRHWPKELVDQGLKPGAIIRGPIRFKQDGHGFPHETEDLQLSNDFRFVETIGESDLYSALLPVADPSIAEIFGHSIVEHKYVIDGTHCRSLGSIAIDPATMSIGSDNYGKIRIRLRDGSGQRYVLPVTDLRLADDDSHEIFRAQMRLLMAQRDHRAILLRIGLARGFDGNGKWTPKRCYIQINGVIFSG